VILGLLGAIVGAGMILSLLLGRFFNTLAERLTTKRTILLTLAVYTGIAAWGYFLDTVIEFWFLAWAVAIVQGGSQALSRSLYSTMAPASQSGEFFGFFTAVARFGAVIGPLLFAAAVAAFGNSRPAVASLAVLFILGGLVLSRVDTEQGRLTAAYHDLTALSYPRHVEGGLTNYGRPESLPEAAQGFRERIRSLDRGQVTGAGNNEEL
jgi:UMF1 family MFS transporter